MTLDAEHNLVPASLYEWSTMYDGDQSGRTVAQTKTGEAFVSTVFLGLDHSFGEGAPLYFETMIFGGPEDQSQWRYTTWAQAEAGHARVVAALEAGIEP